MRRISASVPVAAVLWCAAWACWCAGCGPGVQTGSVSGKATYAGKPLTVGVVTFVNRETGIGASAPLDASGSYQVPSLKVGQYQVAVQPPSGPSPEQVEHGEKAAKLDIPDKYFNPQSSGLTATVKQGQNTADFAL